MENVNAIEEKNNEEAVSTTIQYIVVKIGTVWNQYQVY